MCSAWLALSSRTSSRIGSSGSCTSRTPTSGLPDPASPAGQRAAALDRVIDELCIGYLALVAGTLLLRAARNWHIRRYRAFRDRVAVGVGDRGVVGAGDHDGQR